MTRELTSGRGETLIRRAAAWCGFAVGEETMLRSCLMSALSVTTARCAIAVLATVLVLAGCSGKSSHDDESGGSAGRAGGVSGLGGSRSSGGRSAGGAPSSANGGISSDEAGAASVDGNANGGTPGSTGEAGAGGVTSDGGTDSVSSGGTTNAGGDTATSGGSETGEPSTNGGSPQGGQASGGANGVGPMPGIVCITGMRCDPGNICALCAIGTSQSVVCAPEPANDPDGYAAATAACSLASVLQQCDGPEDCAADEHCIVGKDNTITAQCSADYAGDAPECRFAGLPMHPNCTLCWSDADCPETQQCRFVTGLPNKVGGCLPR